MTKALTLTSAEKELSSLPLRDQLKAARSCGIIPRGMNDDAAIGVALMGRELGIPPVASFRLIDSIQGRPTLRAQGMLAVAYSRLPGFQMEMLESTAEKCSMRMRRDANAPWCSLAFTFKEAQTAGLTGKDNWKRMPADMLRNRVVSKLLRMVAADVFASVYSDDEAGDFAKPADPSERTTVQRVEAKLLGETPAEPEPESSPESEPDEDEALVADAAFSEWQQSIEQASSKEELKGLVSPIGSDDRLTDADRAALGDAIRERSKEL